MNLVQAVILGIVQGATEFLPISSDGHLALTYSLMGMKPDLTYEVFLHAATLIAMFVYFWTDVVRLLSSLLPRNKRRGAADRRIVLLIAAGTISSGLVALVLKDWVEPLSANMTWVGFFFLCTAGLLALGEALSSRRPAVPRTEMLSIPRSLFVGVMQGLAVLPGLSRSGSTIAGSMLAGLSRERAARFSFLLGMPIITLAAALDAVDVLQGGTSLPPLAIAIPGFIAAGVSGYLAVWGLLKIVRNHKLYGFAVYTGVLGTILLVTSILGRG